MLNYTIRSLEDKTSSVRKASIQLLNTLLQTHIYGAIDGGPLNITLIEERYETLCKRLEAIERKEMEVARRNAGLDEDEAENMKSGRRRERTTATGEDEMQVDEAEPIAKVHEEAAEEPAPAEDLVVSDEIAERMRATRKIYAEALYFVQQLENAVPTLKQLLTSKSKAEVLASMEFFQTAHHYQLHFAEVGIKTMLHLIWNKDNNSTTEDGTELKGIRSHVIDVYKRLYFEVLPDPAMSAQQQISRITKNMIERTYNATLAELTSLEELMRTMMAEHESEGVHPDVINRLWHVYSTNKAIDKAQRRGAIIILGMLAIAKRDIVTERVDTLLKIGLGPLGQVRCGLST
jgi:condensin complex subunit 1